MMRAKCANVTMEESNVKFGKPKSTFGRYTNGWQSPFVNWNRSQGEYSEIKILEDDDLYDDEEIEIPELSPEEMTPEEIEGTLEYYKEKINEQQLWNEEVAQSHFVYIYGSRCNLSQGTFQTTVRFGRWGASYQKFYGVFVKEENSWKAIIERSAYGGGHPSQ